MLFRASYFLNLSSYELVEWLLLVFVAVETQIEKSSREKQGIVMMH